ncbi:MAG: hypothetical protein GWN58_51205, partial [Anaerolineae bacterium]|nr:hypothetical protein [Thermoplasmata archaeon]NIV37500.1 hypothetical protein [Anaerolineae bacterium]NIY04767.1 hypothetical protein [Thermoplasmata archaeon]
MAYVPLFGGSVGGGRDVGPAPSESAVVRTEKRFTRPVTFEDLVIFSSGDSDKASARSHTFSTTDETGWKIDGAGNAWFYGTTIIKGATVGELTVTDWITLGTGGLIRTASSGQRVEISEAAEDRITFYSGGSNESAAGFIQSTASSNSPAMWLNGPTSSGGSGGDFNYIKLQSVSYSASYGIELFSVKQDMRFYLVDNTKEIEFAYAGASLQKFAKDSVTFDSSASPGTDYIQFLPGSAGSQIKIADDNPQV